MFLNRSTDKQRLHLLNAMEDPNQDEVTDYARDAVPSTSISSFRHEQTKNEVPNPGKQLFISWVLFERICWVRSAHFAAYLPHSFLNSTT
jgi:hypothetical protein